MTLYELFVKLSADTKGFTAPLADAQSKLGTFGTAAEGLAAKLGTGLGLAAIGAAALSAAKKFDDAFVQIARSTGATGQKLDSLQKSFTEVYKQTSASSEQVTAAFSSIAARTDATGKALEGLVLQMVKLAKTQREDVASLAPLVTRVFGDWSIAANDQAAALKYLQAVSQQTGTQVGKLSETVVYAGAPLRMLGYNFEQATALIGKFEKEGVNTETVLGGMKAALQKFAKEGVVDVSAEWQKFVKGVRDGSITLQEVMERVGAKRGPDLYRAIVEGRYEIDKMTESAKNLAQKGGESIETFTGQMKKLQHQMESYVSSHKDLVITAPFVVMALGTIGGAIKGVASALSAAALGVPALFGATVIAGIMATGKAVDELKAKYEALNKTGKDFIEPWTKTQGAAVSEGLPVSFKKPEAPKAPSAEAVKEYNKALSEAMNLFGLSNKKAEELSRGMAILTKEYLAGRLTIDQYTAAGSRYREEMDKLLGKHSLVLYAQEAIKRSTLDYEKALDNLVSAVQRMFEASTPWGKQLEYARSQLDGLTTSLYAASLAMKDAATQQLSIDWTKAAKGTTLESVLNPEGGVALRRQADAAKQEAQRIRDMWQQGKATQVDWENAQKRAEEAEARATGTTIKHTEAIKVQGVAANEFERETRRAFDNMSRQMAKSILEWKGFGETLKNVAKSFAEGMLEILIRQFFKPLENLMAKAVASLTGWITGGAGQSASSGVMSAVGTGVSGAGGAAGSAIGAGTSGVLGIVTGAVSAVSGVVGNFQMAGMNKSLDLIEHEARYAQIHLLNILEKLNVYIPKLQDIWDYNWNAQFPLLLRMTTALEVGAHGGVTINISGARDARAVAQEVAKELRLRVPAAAFA